ncbi:MAG: lysophospholipid acyltransferase family protein [Chloroflexota bacterium]
MKEEILIKAGKFLMGTYARSFLKMQIKKLEDLPLGAKLFAGNHPTTSDPFFLSLLTNQPVRILVTANVFEIPVFREYLLGCGHIPVTRGKGKGKEVIDRAVEYLDQGKNVGIFPEGSLSPETSHGYGVLPARSGVARIALQSGKPVIPVGIALEKHGIRSREYQFSDRDAVSRWVTKGAYEITVGSPIFFDGDPESEAEVAAAADLITTEIRKLASISESRLPQFRVKWNSMLSYREIFSTFGG